MPNISGEGREKGGKGKRVWKKYLWNLASTLNHKGRFKRLVKADRHRTSPFLSNF